jgi:hypothetical protein
MVVLLRYPATDRYALFHPGGRVRSIRSKPKPNCSGFPSHDS